MSSGFSITAPRVPIRIVILLALIYPGCAQVDRGSIQTFGQAVTAARLQADTAFQAVNELARENQIDRAATQDSLDEDHLRPVLASEDIQKWDNGFREIELYADNLVRLLAPDAPAGTRNSIVALGDRLQALDVAAVPSPVVLEGLARLGKALVACKANSEAAEIIRATDPAIQETLRAMADAIGRDDGECLRGVARSNWAVLMADPQREFLAAKSPGEKRSIVVRFAGMIRRRDAQLSALRSLRRSIQALAEAHATLAADSTADIRSTLEMIRGELSDLREFLKE